MKRKSWNYRRKATGEAELFDEIFFERERVSVVSGENLNSYYGSMFYYNLFAHVIPKAKNRYPKFKLNKKNIALLTPQEHKMWDERRWECDDPAWDYMKALEQELKEEYKLMHPSKSIILTDLLQDPE